MPGGYGTMDEFFESITMIQTGKIRRFPVVLMGKAYHEDLFKFIERLVIEKTIGADDAKIFLFTDSISDAVNHINKHTTDNFGLKKRLQMQPSSFLGEHILRKRTK